MAQSKYSREEVDAILGRAIERENHGDLSHEDLLAAAREIGIPEQAIETAAIEVAAERSERTELIELRRDQWRGFVAHLIPYVMVNALLVTINVLTTHFPWAVFPALGWGIGLASHLWAVLFPSRQHLQYHLEQLRNLERRRADVRGTSRRGRLSHLGVYAAVCVMARSCPRIPHDSSLQNITPLGII